jgi:hypothetical protein
MGRHILGCPIGSSCELDVPGSTFCALLHAIAKTGPTLYDGRIKGVYHMAHVSFGSIEVARVTGSQASVPCCYGCLGDCRR